MKNRSVWLSAIVGTGIILSPMSAYADTVTQSVYQQQALNGFKDLGTNDPNLASIGELLDAGVVNGFPGGLFEPSGHATDAQVITMLVRLLGFGSEANQLQGTTWYSGYAQEAGQLGIVSTSGQITNKPITTLDALMLIAKAIGSAPESGSLSFSDAGQIPTADYGYIVALAKAGYLNGLGGTLDPNSPMTRSQLVSVIGAILSSGK